ncbi:hypothetical protein [Chromobacterium amazonense]|uniref:hypothetical protein n=1 Tax=Chromobacterium TaxID=535 RepID=UPI0026A48A17
MTQIIKKTLLPVANMGTHYSCGSKLGYLKATVNFGLKHPETRQEFSAFLAENPL